MTITEIAELANVSISTVSKIINGKDQHINPKTRDRVLTIVKEYHYTPYGTARDFSTAKTFILAVLLNSATQHPQLLNGILRTAQNHGYTIMLFESQANIETELKNITAICQAKADGVIWEPAEQKSLEHSHYFEDMDISICYLGEKIHQFSYLINYADMGYIMTKKILDYKHEKIACLLKKDNWRSSQLLEGFKKCLYDNKIPFHENMILYSGESSILQNIQTHSFTAILSSHYSDALQLYEQVEKCHYFIPSDLSLICLTENANESSSYPHICNIEIPYYDLGEYVCNKLIQKCEHSNDDTVNEPFISHVKLINENSISTPSTSNYKKLIVVGSVNMDITFHVDTLPQAGKTTTITSSTSSVGGKGANQAVGAAKLHHEVALIASIGSDSDAASIFEVLEKEKVTTQGVHRNVNIETGKAYIYMENSGESLITITPGANEVLTTEILKQQSYLFKNASFCLISSEIPIQAVITAAKLAHQNHTKTILKPAAIRDLPEILYHYIDIFIPNKKEATTLCPFFSSLEDQADFFLQKGMGIIIITLGNEGCYVRTSNISRYFPALQCEVMDTTGGADAFIAALASYLSEGYSLEDAITIAHFAASFCVSRQGVAVAMIDRRTLESQISRSHPSLLNRKNC